ncbi:TetR/AcrR family transcriptional regulator [Millisia brevis]|uniref:TetR/AcrR family transcriptional regulator n=1 Tax=Millisia brevis TaxID=264148 RepID=UPI00082EC9D5|nr:TetR/AcrR family transcriptional regulator [Millisia brevis]
MLSRMPAPERRNQLVEAALTIASRSGVASVTVRAVAEEAGVSLGVVHYCFQDKEEMVTAMGQALVLQLAGSIDTLVDLIVTQMDEPPSGQSGLRDLLYRGLMAMWAHIESVPNRELLTYEITCYALRSRPSGSEASSRIAEEQYRVMDAQAFEFLDRAAALTRTTWTEPLVDLARMTILSIDGFVLRWLVDRDAEAVRRQIELLAGRLAAAAVAR